MSSAWAFVISFPKLVSLLNSIWSSWIEFQAKQIDDSTAERENERLALARAMTGAKDDEDRIRIARVIYRLEHPIK